MNNLQSKLELMQWLSERRLNNKENNMKTIELQEETPLERILLDFIDKYSDTFTSEMRMELIHNMLVLTPECADG